MYIKLRPFLALENLTSTIHDLPDLLSSKFAIIERVIFQKAIIKCLVGKHMNCCYINVVIMVPVVDFKISSLTIVFLTL